jgi:hypothetical protein
VFQTVGTCTSSQAFVSTVQCARVDDVPDPSLLGPFNARRAEYEAGTISLGPPSERRDVLVRATVRYPVDRAGPARLVSWNGRRPIVFVMHSGTYNVAPLPGTSGMLRCGTDRADVARLVDGGEYTAIEAFRGYDGLLNALARSGIIAISIDADDLCTALDRASPSSFIGAGATLLRHHMELWQQIDAGDADLTVEGASIADFAGRIDFQRTGLVGHSRGGLRVLTAIARNDDPAVAIRAVLLVAPTNSFDPAFDDRDIPGFYVGVPALVLGGSRDGDVIDDPVEVYDAVVQAPSALHWIYGANHPRWNARTASLPDPILDSFPVTQPALMPTLTANDQLRMLRAWGRLWFESHLLGRRVADNYAVATGEGVVRGTRGDVVFTSYEEWPGLRKTIDEPRGDFATFEVPGMGTATGFSPPLVAQSLRLDEERLAFPPSTFAHGVSGYVSAWTTGAPRMQYALSPFDASPYDYLVFRAARPQCGQACQLFEPLAGDLSFRVTVSDGDVSRSVVTASLPGRRVPVPYIFSGREASPFRRSVMRSVRVPLRCFPGVDRSRISLIEIAPEGAPQQMMFSDLAVEAAR